MQSSSQPSPLPTAYARTLRESGIVVAPGLLAAGDEVERLRLAYADLIDAAGRHALEATGSPLQEGFEARPLPERFAIALGASGGALLEHLDPQLHAGKKGYQLDTELPPAQLPELFELARASALLDALERFLGPEIAASPIYHFNFKLSKTHRELASRAAAASGRSAGRQLDHRGFHVSRTAWHRDAAFGLPDAHESQIVIAWVPLTRSETTNGCLCALPGTHRSGIDPDALGREELARAVALVNEPGDVVFLDNHTLHSSTENESRDDSRWSVSLRYLPVGQPNGRPWLPGFVARSRANPADELRDPARWTAAWRAALQHATRRRGFARAARKTGLLEARMLTHAWRRQTPALREWERLPSGRPVVPPLLQRGTRACDAALDGWERLLRSFSSKSD